MYSRFSNSPPRNVQIPEHYSGCAFPYVGKEKQTRFFEVATPTPPEESTPPTALPVLPMEHLAPEIPDSADSKEEPVQALQVHPSEPETVALPFAKGFSAIKGLDFDQLLLLGLILLLSRNEEDSDVVMWLGLLLLCS